MKISLLLIITFSICPISFGQKYVISGKVKEGVPGTTVTIKGTNHATTTDSLGNFEIELDKNDSIGKNINPKRLNLIVTAPNISSEKIQIRNYNSKSDQVKISYEIQRFPWPPPQPSATDIIADSVFKNAKKLDYVDKILKNALDSCGYFQKRYYYVPNGFALVTKIEQINNDGTSLNSPNRFIIDGKPSFKFTFTEYIKSLFIAKKGHFRLIVFIETDGPFSETDSTIKKEDAIKWLKGGEGYLPNEIGKYKYSENYKCHIFIYEFIKPDYEEELNFVDQVDSALQGREHLIKSRLINFLK